MKLHKITFVAGAGTGYLLGAKAGRLRYEQIVGKLRSLAGSPAANEVSHSMTAAAKDLAPEGALR